jgi:hypothetical protein
MVVLGYLSTDTATPEQTSPRHLLRNIAAHYGFQQVVSPGGPLRRSELPGSNR